MGHNVSKVRDAAARDAIPKQKMRMSDLRVSLRAWESVMDVGYKLLDGISRMPAGVVHARLAEK